MAGVEIPALRTERLVLRAYRLDDFPQHHAIMSKPEVMRYIGNGQPFSELDAWRSMTAALGHWVLRGYGLFAVEEAASATLLGHCGIIHNIDWPEPELGYTLDRPYWGKGLAVEAGRAVLDWAFQAHPFPRLAGYIDPRNLQSARVAQKLGATRDGVETLRGHMVDRWVYRRPGR